MVQVCPAMPSYTEEMLVIKAQGGDSDAFNELIRRTFSGSLKLARGILVDIEEAEDEVQNAYLKAWLHLGGFRLESKFSTWILRIVTNQCLMRLRQMRGKTFVYLDDDKNGERTRELELVDACRTPEEALSVRQLSELLRRETTGLPPLLRDVLLLRDFHETSISEVAHNLGVTQFAVKSRLLRARTEVRNRLMKRELRSRLRATASSAVRGVANPPEASV